MKLTFHTVDTHGSRRVPVELCRLLFDRDDTRARFPIESFRWNVSTETDEGRHAYSGKYPGFEGEIKFDLKFELLGAPGRPRTPGTGSLISGRWQTDDLRAINAWRERQHDRPDRAGAVRRLVRLAIHAKPSKARE